MSSRAVERIKRSVLFAFVAVNTLQMSKGQVDVMHNKASCACDPL